MVDHESVEDLSRVVDEKHPVIEIQSLVLDADSSNLRLDHSKLSLNLPVPISDNRTADPCPIQKSADESLCPICLELMQFERITTRAAQDSVSRTDVQPISTDDSRVLELTATPCGHIFHTSCLNLSISYKQGAFAKELSCPLCRTPLDPKDPSQETRDARRRAAYWERQSRAFVRAAYDHYNQQMHTTEDFDIERNAGTQQSRSRRVRFHEMLRRAAEDSDDSAQEVNCICQNRVALIIFGIVAISMILALVVTHFISPRAL